MPMTAFSSARWTGDSDPPARRNASGGRISVVHVEMPAPRPARVARLLKDLNLEHGVSFVVQVMQAVGAWGAYQVAWNRDLSSFPSSVNASFPGIESLPEVCGGEPCIVRTRIPVWLIEQWRRLGVSKVGLLEEYSALRDYDIENAWAYARAHVDEIEEQIRMNEEA